MSPELNSDLDSIPNSVLESTSRRYGQKQAKLGSRGVIGSHISLSSVKGRVRIP